MGATLAIIGAGFSGTLLALHVLRRAPSGTTVVLVERGQWFGRGDAYSTGNPNHLLNVPAGRMSAFHDRPADFLDWMRSRPELPDRTPGCFVPRHAFGSYVRDLLKAELRRADRRNRLQLARGTVLRMEQAGPRLGIHLDRDRVVEADLAVLATGNLPPAPPQVADMAFYDSPFYRPDPWAADALHGLPPEAPVLLIGTGLTAVDVITSLLDRQHAGRITALSRRGRLPMQHVAPVKLPVGSRPAYPTEPLDLFRLLRAASRDNLQRGGTWQAAIDDMRPSTQDIWQSMSLPDRRAFLRHLRPWWDIHRHRMAPDTAARLAEAIRQSIVSLRSGRLVAFEPHGPDRVGVRFRTARSQGHTSEVIDVARVINCSGPAADFSRTSDPLLRSLMASGQARPDELRLGLDVTANGAVRERSGAVSRQIFAVGPITRGTFWEMTAVPDLRRQCEALATHLAGLLGTF